MLTVAIAITLGLLALALLLTTWRLIAGPDAADRILALDTLYVNTVALIMVLGIAYGTTRHFEAALLIALLGFVSTVALARFLLRGDVID